MDRFSETVNLHGHIIDSLTLSKVFDEIERMGGDYLAEDIEIGKSRHDVSRARIQVTAPDAELLENILRRLHFLGAELSDPSEARVASAPADGVFPDGFYATSNLDMDIHLGNRWVPVQDVCMDCAILVEGDAPSARCIKMNQVKAGDRIVTGFGGIRVHNAGPKAKGQSFAFMNSEVSSEKPKSVVVRKLAEEIAALKADRGGELLMVCGPAVVHTGAVGPLGEIIAAGFVDHLFAGNALAAHDVEAALYGTSLGVSLSDGSNTPHGHMNHLYAINRIRAAGGLREAVESGLLKRGVVYSCFKAGCELLLAGSIRDDGPLPEVITDVVQAQREMRARVRNVKIAIMLSTMLHSIAVGNLLPASVKTVCVDISPEVVTKLTDRGSLQTVGMVTDVAGFLQMLAGYLCPRGA